MEEFIFTCTKWDKIRLLPELKRLIEVDIYTTGAKRAYKIIDKARIGESITMDEEATLPIIDIILANSLKSKFVDASTVDILLSSNPNLEKIVRMKKLEPFGIETKEMKELLDA